MFSSEVIFADSHGKVTSFSLENHVSNGNFVGPTGSVLSLDVYKTVSGRGFLACVGLDRFLRIYDLSTRANIGKIYCQTKMTSVLILEGSLMSPGRSAPNAKRKKLPEAPGYITDESDSMWAKLPEIGNVAGTSAKRRRLRVWDSRANAI